MKTRAIELFVIFLALLLGVATVAGQSAPPASQTPISEQFRDETISRNREILGKLTGTWKSEHPWEGSVLISELTVRSILEGNFLEGSLTSKDTSGKILYEARLVFSFSPGTLKYLMYLFESTGWAKQFIGDPTDQNIVLRGVTYQGLEQYRWEISENELKRSYWKPQTQFNPESPPDEVVVFQKVK